MGRLLVPPLLLVVAAGCGGETTDVSEAVDGFNRDLQPLGVELHCPDEVDGGEGTSFECTMVAVEEDRSESVSFEIVRENDEYLVDTADEQEFERAMERLTDVGP